MLRIYPVALEMVRDVNVACGQIARKDPDLARQLRRSSMSVVLNLGEGSGSRAGIRRARYETALGSALETRCGLEAAEAAGYVGGLGAEQRNRLAWVVGTLVKLAR